MSPESPWYQNWLLTRLLVSRWLLTHPHLLLMPIYRIHTSSHTFIHSSSKVNIGIETQCVLCSTVQYSSKERYIVHTATTSNHHRWNQCYLHSPFNWLFAVPQWDWAYGITCLLLSPSLVCVEHRVAASQVIYFYVSQYWSTRAQYTINNQHHHIFPYIIQACNSLRYAYEGKNYPTCRHCSDMRLK
jgi:hypothetical protein